MEFRRSDRRDEAGAFRARDPFCDPLDPTVDVELTDPVGTDRRAVADGEVSISPLFVDHRRPDLDALADAAVDCTTDR